MTAQANMPAIPYAETAWKYHSAGWCPIPMPKGAKWPPPDGFTGHHPLAGAADIQAWLDENSYQAGKTRIRPHNIALRMLPNQLGIDVDMYIKHGEEKQGRQSLAELEALYGPLPPTVMSTARDDGSGIRFFRIPEGLAWPGAPKPGIELIQFGHRYAMAPPSINPETNTPYRWLWSHDEPVNGTGIPQADAIPMLPDAWIQGLTGGVSAVDIARISVDRAHGLDWVASHAGDKELCDYMRKVMRAHVDLIVASRSGARHDAAVAATQALVHLAAEGHHGLSHALQGAHAAFQHVTSGEDRPGEWERMVTGAIGVAAARGLKVLGDPCKDPYTGRDSVHTVLQKRQHGAPGNQGATVHTLQPRNRARDGQSNAIPQPSHNSAIWDSRPELFHIAQLARTQLASPWSVLGVILARVVASVPPFVVLPPIVGGYGSLNSFFALVGRSGAGKGISERVASMGFSIAKPAETFNAGSGEGLAHLYARRIRVPKDQGGGTAVERIRDNVTLSVPEVDSLTALGNRQGATLLSQLRQAWSGEHLGFAYADPDKALPIEEHSYRLTMIVGVQPGRAGGILEDSDGGTPQRFVWLSTRLEDDCSEDFTDPPDAWQWEAPGPWKANARGRVVLEVPEHIRDFMRKENVRMRKFPDEFGLDEHHYYAQLKLAGAFALLSRRVFINGEDWELASEMMRISLAERNYIAGVLAQNAAAKAQASGIAEGHKTVAATSVVEGAAIKRVARNLIKKASMDEWRPLRHFTLSLPGRDRQYLEEALDNLVNAGMLDMQTMQSAGGNGTYYRLSGGKPPRS